MICAGMEMAVQAGRVAWESSAPEREIYYYNIPHSLLLKNPYSTF
jgi:hypothetical protein